MDVESTTMRDCASSSVNLNCTDPPPPPLTTPAPFDQAIAQTLYLQECYGISDKFYHELTVLHPSFKVTIFLLMLVKDELYMHCVGLNSSGSRCLKILTLNSCHHLTMVPTTLLKLVLLLSWLMRYCTCILII